MQKNKQTVCTAALIVINMGIFFLLSFLGNPENAVFMIKYGAMYPPLIFEDAQYYRLITCIFLHFGIDHLMNNMVMLGALGWNLEKEIGSFKFLPLLFLFLHEVKARSFFSSFYPLHDSIYGSYFCLDISLNKVNMKLYVFLGYFRCSRLTNTFFLEVFI